MGRIRPFVQDDIPDVVALRRQTFRYSDRATADELGAFFQEVFFDERWRDEELPSLVYEGVTGRAVGFVGVFPRRMLLEGEPIRVAVTTQLMVQRESRGTAAVELLFHVLRGPQDLSLTDAVTDVARRIWEKLGGRTATLYSLHWIRPLRPWRYTAATLGGSAIQRAIRLLGRPLLNLADIAATRLGRGPFLQRPTRASANELGVAAILESWPTMTKGFALVPDYDAGMLEYLLGQLAQKRSLGALQRVLVREADGTAIGWYLYYSNPGGIGDVVHVVGTPGKQGDVLDHMFHHAWRRGVIALRGRLEPKQIALLTGKHCVFNRDGGWSAIHSRRSDVMAAVERGDAMISRLDGEFWMAF